MAIILHIILSVYIIRLVCSTLSNIKEFGSYWFETGTPTYLVKLLKSIIMIWNGWHTRRQMPKC